MTQTTMSASSPSPPLLTNHLRLRRERNVEHVLKKIPSYSPHLNPIEYCFHSWKTAIKREDQVTTSITLQQQIDNAAALITDKLVSRCLDHVYRYYVTA